MTCVLQIVWSACDFRALSCQKILIPDSMPAPPNQDEFHSRARCMPLKNKRSKSTARCFAHEFMLIVKHHMSWSHRIIPSKWIYVDRNRFAQHQSIECTLQYLAAKTWKEEFHCRCKTVQKVKRDTHHISPHWQRVPGNFDPGWLKEILCWKCYSSCCCRLGHRTPMIIKLWLDPGAIRMFCNAPANNMYKCVFVCEKCASQLRL